METKTGSIDEKAIFYVLECNFHLGELATASVTMGPRARLSN
jgi:hypothetical protein